MRWKLKSEEWAGCGDPTPKRSGPAVRGHAVPTENAEGRRSGRPLREDIEVSLSTSSVPRRTGTFNDSAFRASEGDSPPASEQSAGTPAAACAGGCGVCRVPLIGSGTKIGRCLQLPPVLVCPARSKAMDLCRQRGTACVCGAALCYAQKGNGRQPCVRARRTARLEFWRQDPVGWTKQLVQEVRSLRRLRLFSTGDFADLGMIDAIAEIVASTPSCSFWAPTKTWLLGEPWTTKLQQLHALPNVSVLLSLPGVDDIPQDWADILCPGLPVAHVHDKTAPVGHACPAVLHHSSCDEEGCSACLKKKTECVDYTLHSRRC